MRRDQRKTVGIGMWLVQAPLVIENPQSRRRRHQKGSALGQQSSMVVVVQRTMAGVVAEALQSWSLRVYQP